MSPLARAARSIRFGDFDFDVRYRRGLIERGIYHFPVACKQGSISYAHTEVDIDRTLEATEEVLGRIATVADDCRR